MTAAGKKALIVEDEFIIAEALRAQLADIGFDVCGMAATAEDAVRLAQEHRPDLVLMDMRLDGPGDGVDAALAIHETVGSRVIFVTGSREDATIERINEDHPLATLFKPVSSIQLRRVIQAVF
ncbi:MAG: response regulator [Sphingobium sp.]|nr:response regulator [Sphingobium sp.]